MLTGVQGGKTITGCVWLANQFAKYPTQNHAIVAPTYKILEQATLPKFFEIFPSYKKYYSVLKSKIQLPGCGNIFIRSADKATSLEGMTLKSGWIDEAGDISRYAWIIMQARTTTTLGQLFLTTRAYGINWLKREFYEFWKKGDKDYDVIDFESRENPGFTQEEWERTRRTLDPRIFAMMYQGRFTEMVGRVYEQFNERKHVVSTIPYKDIVRTLGGVDWGYTQPAALIIAGFTKDGKCYVMEEFYKAGLTLDVFGAKAIELMKKYQVQVFFADPSEPMDIRTFRDMKIPINEGKRDVTFGINKIREMLGTEKLFVKDTCLNLRDEFQTYQYPEDREMVSLKEDPIKRNDHGLDALRYIIATSDQANVSVLPGVISSREPEKEILSLEQIINMPKGENWLQK